MTNQITLDQLRSNPEFRDFWAETLKGIRKFNMNEAMLMEMHRPKQRVGAIDDINSQAALDMHRLEGALEVWEALLDLNSFKVVEDTNDSGDDSI